MKTKESPDVLFSRIASLKSYYGVLGYDDQQRLAVVSNAVPTEYKVIIAVEERRHKKAITNEQLETCLMSYWRREHGDFEHRDQKRASEFTFSAVATKPNTRIKCHRCGQRGHVML
jgi:hypothetical protein